jgi:hypothetical protein
MDMVNLRREIAKEYIADKAAFGGIDFKFHIEAESG